MAKSHEDTQHERETIDNRLDIVLVTALQENFQIQDGCHIDRAEMVEFLRNVVQDHPDLEFVLHHRDTKLSGRIYKAFPQVTTRRVAVPNERGKKVWRYTNLKRISETKELEQNVQAESDPNEPMTVKKEPDPSLTEPQSVKGSKKTFARKRKRRGNQNSMVKMFNQSDSVFDFSCHNSFSENNDHNTVNKDIECDVGQFSDMLKWVKEQFVLDPNSSVQVKRVVDGIKAKFKTNVTYKQSHKLVFSVFPGACSRVVNPVRLEVRGSFYAYRGIAPKSKQRVVTEESVRSQAKTGKPNRRTKDVKSVSTKHTWVPPSEIARKGRNRPKQSRKRFLESCATLKKNLDKLESFKSYDPVPESADVAAMERESAWQRMVDELKQERDQAILERNQAMISLMELERDQESESRSTEEPARPKPACFDRCSSVGDGQSASTENDEEKEGENRDWLRSLINRSNHILGEQMSEANSMFFPGSTLQSSTSPRQAKYPRYSGEYIEMERFEKLKNERDLIWKGWMEKVKQEKETEIQQLKLEKMEVIQKMELEKSDAIECVEEKLTNQITILTRELRELKELLNHTMNERTLAIRHAQKLMELVEEKTLKEKGLDSLPFDLDEGHVIHLTRQRSTEETENQTLQLSAGKGNKRKQSMPAKVKKSSKTENCVSTNSEKYCTEPEGQVLTCSDKQDGTMKGKASPVEVSSIDCLNSIVESIGRQSPGKSQRKFPIIGGRRIMSI